MRRVFSILCLLAITATIPADTNEAAPGNSSNADAYDTDELGLVKPGDPVATKMTVSGKMLGGEAFDAGGWVWSSQKGENSMDFTSTVPMWYAGMHRSEFRGTWTVDGTGTGGHPKTWELDVTANLKVIIEQCPNGFEPGKGDKSKDTVKIRAYVDETVPSDVKGRFVFYLFEVSDEPGYCMNANRQTRDARRPLPVSGADSDSDKDLKFHRTQNQAKFTLNADLSVATTKKTNLREATVAVQSFDYGAYGKIKVKFLTMDHDVMGVAKKDKPDAPDEEFVRIPRDDNKNHIPDGKTAWDKDGEAHEASDDLDKDGFTRYQEWRGFMVNGTHERTSVKKKDLFVFNVDSTLVAGIGNYMNASGINVHKINVREWTGVGEHAAGKRIVNPYTETAPGKPQYGIQVYRHDRLTSPSGRRIYGWKFLDGPLVGPPKSALRLAINIEALQEDWQIPANYKKVSRRVVAHEMGHGTGLGHSGRPPLCIKCRDVCIMSGYTDGSILRDDRYFTQFTCKDKIDVEDR